MEDGKEPQLKENLLQQDDVKEYDLPAQMINERHRSRSENQEKYILKINSDNNFNYLTENKDNTMNRNKISTSKYNCLNVIPKILYEQFSKVANIYFLILAILQMIPQISPSGGSPVILAPLMFVVIVNGLKDYYEDYKRKESDNRENRSKVTVCAKQGDYISNWEDIKVGSIIKVYSK